MGKIDPDDISEVVPSKITWVYCDPDRLDQVKEMLGWADDDIIVKYNGEHYFCSVRLNTSSNTTPSGGNGDKTYD